MNFDKISFRPNANEKAFLDKANQKYRCRTVTGLLHKVFAEFMAKSSENLDASHDIPSHKGYEEKLVMKDTRLDAIQPIQSIMDSKPEPVIEVNPFLEPFRDVILFEQARQELERLIGNSRWQHFNKKIM